LLASGCLKNYKGTARPDWINMKVVPLDALKRTSTALKVFDFLISLLNILKDFKVLSRFMQK
jgi:hypothetical protein